MEGRRDRGREGKRERGRGGKEGGFIPTHSDTEELLLDTYNEAVSHEGKCLWIISRTNYQAVQNHSGEGDG